MGKFQKQAAKKYKYKQSMVKRDLYLELSDSEFYGFSYAHLTPSGYGSKIEKRLMTKLGVGKVNRNDIKGDFVTKSKSKNKLYGEIKTTYLDVDGFYHVTHIRQWHEFDVYLLCFINPTTCKAEYIMVKKDVFNQLPLTNMNLTSNDNQENNHVEKRFSLTENSDYMKFFKSENLLKSTSFKDLSNYIDQRDYFYGKLELKINDYIMDAIINLYNISFKTKNYNYFFKKVCDHIWDSINKDFGDQPKRRLLNKFVKNTFNDVILNYYMRYNLLFEDENPEL